MPFARPLRRILTPSLYAVTVIAAAPPVAAQGCANDLSPEVERVICFGSAVMLETEQTTSANVSVGDLNGDGHLDIVLIRGRHWPVTNRVLFGDGKRGFHATNLGDAADRSYTGALADIDGDGDLDIVVSNDRPDANPVYLNNGQGEFSVRSRFGREEWKTRNIALADMNGDGLVDVIVANRGPRTGPSPNFICPNLGAGRFPANCHAFSLESATTISVVDINADGTPDLLVPHRDGGQSHLYLGEPGGNLRFAKHPFGPEQASIRATAVADFDGDGAMDIVAIHTGNSEGGDGVVDRGRDYQGATIYPGDGTGEFPKAIALDDSSRMPYALAVADVNDDGRPDVIVGYVKASTRVFLNRPDRRGFQAIELGDADGSTYGFAIADLDADGYRDIVVAKSGARNRVFYGSGGRER